MIEAAAITVRAAPEGGGDVIVVSELGLGGTALGGMYESMTDEVAEQTIRAAWASGVRYFDTAPMYGSGRSEARLGAVLSKLPRSEFVVSTKVGRVLEPSPALERSGVFADPLPFEPVYDFSRDGVFRSIEGSLERLLLDGIDICYVHDPDRLYGQRGIKDPDASLHVREVLEETLPALLELRSQGVVRAIGVGLNHWDMLCEFARAGGFDCFLLAGRYTLLDQTAAETLIPLCRAQDIDLVIGGPFSSGILASGATPGAMFNYEPAPPAVLNRVREIEQGCEHHAVSLKAAALHFPLRETVVKAVIPGARSADEVQEIVEAYGEHVAESLWDDLGL